VSKILLSIILLFASISSKAEIFECIGIVQDATKDVEFLHLDTATRKVAIKVANETLKGEMTLARQMNPEGTIYTLYFKAPDPIDPVIESEYIFYSQNNKSRISGVSYLNLSDGKHLDSFTANNNLKCRSITI